jgi:cephalosporin hydroxylase
MDLENQIKNNIAAMGADFGLQKQSLDWLIASAKYGYSYNFSWMGRPIIQYPQDVIAMQEIIWTVRPDLIIETGIARGGSLIFSASQLALLDMCDAIESGAKDFDPSLPHRKVIGVDIDIRTHNYDAIRAHPMSSRIQMIKGSSIDPKVIDEISREVVKFKKVLVCLDSNHTGDHVLEELRLYTPFVSDGSYCVVFDTVIEDMPDEFFHDRPWGKGNSPKTAVLNFLKNDLTFSIDKEIDNKLQVTVAPGGYLRKNNV